MKRFNSFMFSALVIVFLFAGSAVLRAQGYSVNTLKFGYFNPADTKGGFIIGGILGTAIDEAVDVGIGVDFFRGTNSRESKIESSTSGAGTKETGWRLDAEASSTIIPLTAQVNVKIPASYSMYWTAGGGVGYEMLWTKEKEFAESGQVTAAESRFYHGFRWVLNAGVLYHI